MDEAEDMQREIELDEIRQENARQDDEDYQDYLEDQRLEHESIQAGLDECDPYLI